MKKLGGHCSGVQFHHVAEVISKNFMSKNDQQYMWFWQKVFVWMFHFVLSILNLVFTTIFSLDFQTLNNHLPLIKLFDILKKWGNVILCFIDIIFYCKNPSRWISIRDFQKKIINYRISPCYTAIGSSYVKENNNSSCNKNRIMTFRRRRLVASG